MLALPIVLMPADVPLPALLVVLTLGLPRRPFPRLPGVTAGLYLLGAPSALSVRPLTALFLVFDPALLFALPLGDFLPLIALLPAAVLGSSLLTVPVPLRLGL